ncbi:MAG TPA: shikimate kinase [Alteraurantiacibacter sp.]|jgi:shikimate kinase
MTIEQDDLSHAEMAALAKRVDRPIALIGMMGVGKSTVGRKLAALLQLPFADADDEIEEAAQLSIGEIFERFGEEYFRDGERRVIERLVEGGPGVIATGGGAFCQEETRQLLLEKAIPVWLDADLDVLVERVGRKDTRPLLKDRDSREVLSQLREARMPFYRQAPIHITSAGGPHQATAMRILKELDSWL